jgi:F-type H+-transporting ATPase subunit epsilon
MKQEKSFFLEIVTPTGIVYSGQAEFAVVPGGDGELGILAGHAALLSEVKLGELRFTHGAETESLVVEEGVLEIRDNRVSVAVESAVHPDRIDRALLVKLKSEAEQRIAENKDPGVVARARHDLRRVELVDKLEMQKRGRSGDRK